MYLKATSTTSHHLPSSKAIFGGGIFFFFLLSPPLPSSLPLQHYYKLSNPPPRSSRNPCTMTKICYHHCEICENHHTTTNATTRFFAKTHRTTKYAPLATRAVITVSFPRRASLFKPVLDDIGADEDLAEAWPPFSSIADKNISSPP